MTTLNIFANQSGQIPLSQLDTNFATPITIGTTDIALGDTATTISNLILSGADLGTPTGNLANCTFPTLNQNTTGTASSVTGLVNVGNGGTGVTTSTGTGSTVLSASPTFTGTLNSANLAYTGALTGGTGVVAIGTNQIYKDASGNVGIGTNAPSAVLYIASDATGTDFRSLSTKAGIALNFTGTGVSYYDSDTTIFRTSTGSGSTERMRIDSVGNVTLQENISVGGAAPTTVGTGITFPATLAASSNANTLDDYEEGTWTPTYVNFTITSGTSEARYTKVGRVITANIWINATSVSCLADATFTLPIAAVSYSAGSAVSETVVSGIQITGSTTGTVREAITTTTNLALTVTYQLAS